MAMCSLESKEHTLESKEHTCVRPHRHARCCGAVERCVPSPALPPPRLLWPGSQAAVPSAPQPLEGAERASPESKDLSSGRSTGYSTDTPLDNA